MTTLSCLMVFLSGASALVFEMIWFRLASLSLGSSVWAASLVLASFMGGLALGNGLLALWGHRFRRPLAVYAAAEVVIAFTGLGLVVLFPHLSGILAPMFTPFLDHPALLNFLRAVTAMCLMILPATAMGATLPLLVRAWYADLPNFGRILGGIYGWNTLGAVAGVMAAEVVLVPFLGLRGSGFAAAAADLSAAFLALWADARMPKAEMAVPPKVQEDGHRKWQAKSWRFLATAFFSGLVLLALEVVWFRFLLLFVHPISWPLAVMLAWRPGLLPALLPELAPAFQDLLATGDWGVMDAARRSALTRLREMAAGLNLLLEAPEAASPAWLQDELQRRYLAPLGL